MNSQILIAGQVDFLGNPTKPVPLPLTVKISNIKSFSIYSKFAVMVDNNGTPYAIGDNDQWPIYAGLGKFLKQWKRFSIIENGERYLVESAVCGQNYTLYLLKQVSDESLCLGYVLRKRRKGHPYFLDMLSWDPVAIYGGHDVCAAIDVRGAIHITTELSAQNCQTEIVHLPYSYLPRSLAFQQNRLIVLANNDSVYDIDIYSDSNSFEYCELDNIKMISGVADHCLAVSYDGNVYSRGDGKYGKLGMGHQRPNSQFLQIGNLVKTDIVFASAGLASSLFIDKTGKVLSCGYNGFGENLYGYSSDDFSSNAKRTVILENANMCISAKQISVVFISCEIPPNSPNLTHEFEAQYPLLFLFLGAKRDSNFENNDNVNNPIVPIKVVNELFLLSFLLTEENKRLKAENVNLQKNVNEAKKANSTQKKINQELIKRKNTEIERLKQQILELKQQIQKNEQTSSDNDDEEEVQYDIDDDYD